PHIDPFIAYRPHILATLPFAWDLLYDPRTLRVMNGGVPSASWTALSTRSAAWARSQDGGMPIQSLLLVFQSIPLKVEVKPRSTLLYQKSTHPRGRQCVSSWDVLYTLYRTLRAPIDSAIYHDASVSKRDRMRYSAAHRIALLPQDHPSYSPPEILNVDMLGGRRRFLGIRVAARDELPEGRKFGEVFVVEVG
ncbi:hypothetical protein C8Q77DRAFT_1042213, partial [Trametes polyzona]